MTHPIENKTILLGVTGSVAAYKAVDLASKLTQAGAIVETILTESAQKFVTPLSFQSVTGRKTFIDADLWSGEGHVVHVGLGLSGDLLLIAPASANTMAKLAHGTADNLLSIAALAARCPILVAPAMDAGMYSHPATQANVKTLKSRGVIFIGPTTGRMASGLIGLGRFVEPLEIVGQVRFILSRQGPLAGKKVVVTAGGTQEPIDPVRIITNHSSGKQGYAVAQAALDAGASVTLISTATHLAIPMGCEFIKVNTAEEMYQAVMQAMEGCFALVMAAAVADFKPVNRSQQKIKKQSGLASIELGPTTDILQEVARYKERHDHPRRVIGFAAESQNLFENAREKLQHKKLDMIVANDILGSDSGFEVDTNQVTILLADGNSEKLPTMEKTAVAERIIRQVVEWV
jgi:phosphopantothenoylcysteine decarboxylase / phosphopantothenate---cysteine ligase